MVKRIKVEEEKLPSVPAPVPRWAAKAVRDWAYQTGEMPQMFLLRIARGEEVDGRKPTWDERIDAAKACAPYFAPKLQSVTVTDSEEHDPPHKLVFNEEVLESLTDAELDLFQKLFGKLLGRPDPGEGQNNADKKKTENRYTRTLDLSAESVATKSRSG